MDTLFIDLGPFSIRTFTALIAAAVLLGLVSVTRAAFLRRDPRPLRWFDAGLGALIGGVIGARLFHVLLTWNYFVDHLGEIPNIRAGGLSWHGAVYGGLIGLWLVARWRDVPFRPLTDAVALIVPVGVMAVWQGCWASACGYGKEVWTLADFPAWAVSERADIFGIVAPRYNAQLFGVWLGAGLLAVIGLIALLGWLKGYRLWIILALAGAGMFILAFFRGDQVPSFLRNLTQDQLLDTSVVVFGIITAVGTFLSGRRSGVGEKEYTLPA